MMGLVSKSGSRHTRLQNVRVASSLLQKLRNCWGCMILLVGFRFVKCMFGLELSKRIKWMKEAILFLDGGMYLRVRI
jgi:hypothetical protein